jgi:hypothetical protein
MITKEELIKMLQDEPSPMNTPVSIYLECTNNDKGILGESITEARYSKNFECVLLDGTYEEED